MSVPTKEMLAIGDKIRKAKGKKSYYEVAKKANVTSAAIKRIEEGAHCSVSTLLDVCDVLDLKMLIIQK